MIGLDNPADLQLLEQLKLEEVERLGIAVSIMAILGINPLDQDVRFSVSPYPVWC